MWLTATLCLPAVLAAAHYTGYPHGSSDTPTSLDIVLGVEDAGPADHGADYHQYINSLAGRPMEPFRWYPYVPVGRPLGGEHTPSSWPEYQPDSGKRPSAAHKPTILYLEGDTPPGADSRPGAGGDTGPDGPGRRPALSPPAELFVCPDHHSCSEAVWQHRDTRRSRSWAERGCFCDAECRRYGDCCRDAPALQEESQDETQAELGTAGDDGDPGELAGGENFVCRSVLPFSSLPSTVRSAESEERWYMLDACPRDFDGYDNKVRCEVPGPADEDPLSALPVTSITTNTTYSSLFCAMCHNDTAQLAFWQLGLRCPGVSARRPPPADEVADRLTATPGGGGGWGLRLDSGRVTPCEVVARPPAAVEPRACRALSQSCARSSPRYEACRNHTALVYAGGRAFRNVYCQLCSGGSPAALRCGPPCGPAERPADSGGLRLRLQLGPGLTDRCRPAELYDPFSGRCRSTLCSRPGFELVDGVCVRTEEERDDAGEDTGEEGDGREDRREEGDESDLMNPADDLLPTQGQVDTENAIDVDLLDNVSPMESGALTTATQSSLNKPSDGEPEQTAEGSGAAGESAEEVLTAGAESAL